MKDQGMKYEKLVAAGWDTYGEESDPYKLAKAGYLTAVDERFSNEYSHKVRFGLSSAIMNKVVQNLNTEFKPQLFELNKAVWDAKDYSEFCLVMEHVEKLFSDIKSK